jgi:hypothetical protein
MGIEHVLHRLAIRYKSGAGIRAMADDLGVNYQVLVNKLNPNTHTHHVYVEDLDELVTLLDTDDVAKYFAAQRNMVCVKSPGFDDLSDNALLDLFIDLESRKAQWLERMKDALSDGKVTRGELAEIRCDYSEFIAATAEVMARIELYLQASEARAARLPLGGPDRS